MHGRGATEHEVRRAIDLGVAILDAIDRIPRAAHIVYEPRVEIFRDPDGRDPYEEGHAVVIESRHPDGSTDAIQAFPTPRTDLERGKEVSWEWNFDRIWPEAWYRDPRSGKMTYGWTEAAEFIGRHIEDL